MPVSKSAAFNWTKYTPCSVPRAGAAPNANGAATVPNVPSPFAAAAIQLNAAVQFGKRSAAV